MTGERESILEFFEDDLHHALQLTLFVGGKMIEIVTHVRDTLSNRPPDGKPSGAVN
jgi:hypothetical protein